MNTIATEPLLSALKLKRKHTFGKKSNGRTVQWSPHKQFFEPPEETSQFFSDSGSNEEDEEEDEDEITGQDPELQDEILQEATTQLTTSTPSAPPPSQPPSTPSIKVVKAHAANDGPRASALFRDPDLETVKLSITPTVAQYETIDTPEKAVDQPITEDPPPVTSSPAKSGQRKGSILGNLFKNRGKRSVSDNLNSSRTQSDSDDIALEQKRSVSDTVISRSAPVEEEGPELQPIKPKEIPFSETALAAYLDDDSAMRDLLLIVKSAFQLSPEEEQQEMLKQVEKREACEVGWDKLSSRLSHLSRTLDTALVMYIDPQ